MCVFVHKDISGLVTVGEITDFNHCISFLILIILIVRAQQRIPVTAVVLRALETREKEGQRKQSQEM